MWAGTLWWDFLLNTWFAAFSHCINVSSWFRHLKFFGWYPFWISILGSQWCSVCLVKKKIEKKNVFQLIMGHLCASGQSDRWTQVVRVVYLLSYTVRSAGDVEHVDFPKGNAIHSFVLSSAGSALLGWVCRTCASSSDVRCHFSGRRGHRKRYQGVFLRHSGYFSCYIFCTCFVEVRCKSEVCICIFTVISLFTYSNK